MSKNPIAAVALLGIMELSKNLQKVCMEDLIAINPDAEISDEVMQKIKLAIQDGVEKITCTDDVDKGEMLLKLLQHISER